MKTDKLGKHLRSKIYFDLKHTLYEEMSIRLRANLRDRLWDNFFGGTILTNRHPDELTFPKMSPR